MSTKPGILSENDHDILVAQKSETVRSIRNNYKEKEAKTRKYKKKHIYFR